jgi:voltage-gated potassium channel
MAMTEQVPRPDQPTLERERWELLQQLQVSLEGPMTALGFVWLGLLILDLTVGLAPPLQLASNGIWALFVVDFVLKLVIAPSKRRYLRGNWFTAISLLLPALRVLRAFRVFRLLRAVRATRSVSLLRLVTSINRGAGAARRTLGRRGVGYVITLTILVTFTGAAGMAYFESPTALREAGYTQAEDGIVGLVDYGEALWWTAMIMTTLGSEYWPRTAEGRVLAWLLALYAFAIFGYITATIASYFLGPDRATTRVDSLPEWAPVEMAALREEVAALRSQIAALTAQNAASSLPNPPPASRHEPYSLDGK